VFRLSDVRQFRILHFEDVGNVFMSLYIVRLVKSKRLRWSRDAFCMGETKIRTEFWWGKLLESGYLEDREGDGSITLWWLMEKLCMRLRATGSGSY
jgi:hypothetical protein